MSFIRNLFAPSLLRALVGRTVVVSVAALVILAAVALYESNDLVSKQFQDEANIVASTAAKQIDDQAALMTRAASLIAGLPTTRELTEDKDADGLRAFLIPQKSRLSVDIMNVADINGIYVSGAQDFKPGDALKPELLALAKAGAQSSWVLYDEQDGLVIRAIYQIRGRDQEPVGVVEIGSVLGNDYLKTINTKSDAQILLVWNGQVRASTFVDATTGKAAVIDGSILPTVEAVDSAEGDTLFKDVHIQGRDFYGIFHVVRSQRQNPGVLAVLVPTDALATAQRTLLAIMGALAAGLIVLVTFFAYRSAAAMTSPLSDLAGAAQRIEAGDLGVSVRQRSQHDIGTLERAFDTMARSLHDRERAQQEYLAEVRAVNEVADAVVGVTDRERIFAESLSRMATLFNADGASIVIREDPPGAPSGSGGRLVPATVMNIDPDTAVAIATRVLVSSVHDPNRIQHAQVPNSPLPYVAHIPLSARGRAVGLLSAYFKEPRDISETESRALRTIARLVSVAKENADLVSELRENNLALERANRLKSEFLASVSHELRTPMNAIIGYTKLMLDGLDGELTDQQIADLQRVAQAADNLLSLINGLLDLAKIEAGKMELNSEEVNIAMVVEEVVELVRPQADAKGLALEMDVSRSLPAAFADRARVRQVLVNLAANAVKFTERGSVTIAAAAADGWITLAVTDTGVGIPPDAQIYIFDEFRQADSSTTRKYGGTGLGLAISKRLVALHGGRIWVDSAAGVGSTFRFTLPVRMRVVAPDAVSAGTRS